MDKQVQAAIVRAILDEKCAPLFEQKGREYTGASEDVNANFKTQSADWGMHPLQVWGVFANKHMASLKTYVKDVANGEDPTPSEPIVGRIADLINYLLLLAGLIEDLGLAEAAPIRDLVNINQKEAQRGSTTH
jgi:hypothetical protein